MTINPNMVHTSKPLPNYPLKKIYINHYWRSLLAPSYSRSECERSETFLAKPTCSASYSRSECERSELSEAKQSRMTLLLEVILSYRFSYHF